MAFKLGQNKAYLKAALDSLLGTLNGTGFKNGIIQQTAAGVFSALTKSTAISSSSTDSEIPTAKAVKDAVDAATPAWGNITGELEDQTDLNTVLTSQSAQIANKADKIIVGFNLFNKDDSANQSGYYLGSDGGLNGNSNYGVSGYISIKPSTNYSYKSRQSAGSYDCFYDENKTFISSLSNAIMPKTITTPSNAKYIRLTYGTAEADTTIFNEGDSVRPYSAYTTIDVENTVRNIAEADVPNYAVASMVGKNGLLYSNSSISANTNITLTDFPYYLRENESITLYCKFSSYSNIIFGKGLDSYRGDWFQIGGSSINHYHYESSSAIVDNTPHGLTISDYIAVNIYFDKSHNLILTINTKSGSFTKSYTTDANVFSGSLFFTSATATTDVKISAYSSDIRKPLWILGDSYMGYTTDRVLYQLKLLGCGNGYCADSLAGASTEMAYNDFLRMLNFGCPKILVLYTGMNDSSTDYNTYMQKIKSLCDAYGIELILNKIPTVPDRDRSAINQIVENSGLRYIDSYGAVGATSSGTWYTGFLASDNVHPTELGAKALAMRMLVDVPELMMGEYET